MTLVRMCSSKKYCKTNEKLCSRKFLKFLPHLLTAVVFLNILGYLSGYRFPLSRKKSRDDEYEYYYEYEENDQSSINNYTRSTTAFDFKHLQRTPSDSDVWPVNQNPFTPVEVSSYVTAFPGDRHYFRGWQDFSIDSSRRLLAFSAWLDHRMLERQKTDVARVLVFSSLGSNLSDVRCSYRHSKHTNFHSPEKILSIFPIGSNYDDDSQLKSYVITCPLRWGQKPTEINLFHPESNLRTEGGIPVQVPMAADHKLALTACAIVEYFPVKNFELHENYRLLEWIIMQRILGVKHITVYINLANPKHKEMVSLLLIYRRMNMNALNIRFYNYAFKTQSSYGHKKHLAPLASDCYYSYLLSSERVMILGIEDFIIPKKEKKIIAVLENLKSEDDSIEHFRFAVNYFYLDFLPRFELTPFSTLLRYVLKVNKTSADPIRRTKIRSILGTNSCLAAGFTGCEKTLGKYLNPTSGDSGEYYSVDEDTAAVHKYTSCVDLEQGCKNFFRSIDQAATKYERILLKRLKDNFFKYFNHSL